MSPRRIIVSLAAVAALFVSAPAAMADGGCAGSDLRPDGSNGEAVEAAVLCLVNEERAAHGIGRLRHNDRLERAATRHSRDMVQRRYFAHESPDGADMVRRARQARYITARVAWSVGENLAWGSAHLSTPQAIVQAWMDSPGHRANMLTRRFREGGIGVVEGSPRGGGPGGTYTMLFGRRG